MVVATRHASGEKELEHSEIENESMLGAMESIKRETSVEVEILPAASALKNATVVEP